MNKIFCIKCGKEIEIVLYQDGISDLSNIYEHKGFYYHQECFNENISTNSKLFSFDDLK